MRFLITSEGRWQTLAAGISGRTARVRACPVRGASSQRGKWRAGSTRAVVGLGSGRGLGVFGPGDFCSQWLQNWLLLVFSVKRAHIPKIAPGEAALFAEFGTQIGR